MAKKEIELLQKQIDKLDSKDFDFEAWKKYTVIMLSRIFGSDNEKIKQLENIDYEFSSWSLRDASGNESYEEGSKKLAQEVLKAAIDELELFGLPKSLESTDQLQGLLTIILDEFKGSQVKEIKSVIHGNDSDEEKQRRVKELVADLGQHTCYDMITKLMLSSDMANIL